MIQYSIDFRTEGRGTIDISSDIDQLVKKSGVDTGLCQLYIHPTSASLIITDNADRAVRKDLENYFSRLVVDGDPVYLHDAEGPDDMPAHIRSILTQTEISVPVSAGSLAMGTWQGIYLWEHRTSPHRRRLTVTLQGDSTQDNPD